MNQLPKRIYHYGEELYLYTGQEAIREVRIQTIEDIKKIYPFEELSSFRGQSDSTWRLTSSLERNAINVPRLELEKMISNIYGQFTCKKKLTLDDISDLQHYEAPTRLLDFTSSFDVALYFASTELPDTDAAVFCLKNIVHSSMSISPEDILRGHGINVLHSTTIDKSKLLSKFAFPEQKNYRIEAQKGYFIHARSVEYTFEESLSYTLGGLDLTYLSSDDEPLEDILKKSTLVKVIISSSLKEDIKEYLETKGINKETIYPDQRDDLLGEIKPVIEYIKYSVAKFNFFNRSIQEKSKFNT